jgi:hypothetical protein
MHGLVPGVRVFDAKRDIDGWDEPGRHDVGRAECR